MTKKKELSQNITTEILPGIFVTGFGTTESVGKWATEIKREIVQDRVRRQTPEVLARWKAETLARHLADAKRREEEADEQLLTQYLADKISRKKKVE